MSAPASPRPAPRSPGPLGGWLAVAALNGGVAVAAGAYASHGLAAAGEQAVDWARTASQYQMWHALALAALALAGGAARGRAFALARWAFLLGTLLFCGSLYALAFGAPRGAAAGAPVGGAALMLGWAAVAAGGLRLARRA